MMFVRFFLDSLRWRVVEKVLRESGESSGKGVGEKSMAWSCEVLFRVIGDKQQRCLCDFFLDSLR